MDSGTMDKPGLADQQKFTFTRSVQKLEKKNSEFKPVKLCLNVDLVSHSARADGMVNTDTGCHLDDL